MAIVLPQGRFNNTSDKDIRDFIAERARILAVVDWIPTLSNLTPAPTRAFYLCKSGTMTLPKAPFVLKLRTTTSFSLSLKKVARIIPAITFFSKIAMGNTKLDENGHLIVDHDLHNHNDELPDGIAEAFIEWAKSENLTFWCGE